jgi:WD40 repeat protein/tRNA A-37 threonylcarbamoyl transferase component Bud32/plasmid maintenance system antidote protein VapI
MSATPEREGRIFDVARKLPVEERAFYLDGACAGDAVLRKQVEELLEANDAVGVFLPELASSEEESQQAGASPAPGGTVRQEPSRSEQQGDTIGRYRLLEQIGEGGCGVVYVAEQEAPVRRRVALKVIKLGMDTRSVMARFEAERQALALMDHPNIAKVFDAGATETGRPFFVMELVRGVKITDYCDQHKLSTAQRLDLFVQVCHAIQHAHQKGIIHRDIKPSNILVMMADDKPVPKVIDFGIAKATAHQTLTDKTLYTAFEQFIGTPAYMSPEQAGMSGLDVDTRSDIYSLGVLLYELLTGSTPFDTKELLESGLDHMRQIIREREPVRPSTRLTQLPSATQSQIANRKSKIENDLDWIVMKCLQKDRTRRYETANGLVADLEHHLSHEPVVARPPSTAYRVQKFVRRNKVMVTAAAAVALALVLGIVASTWLALRERQQRARAEANEQRAEAGKLLALAQTQLEDDPTAALAYTRASLALADTPEARRFAVKVLWRGPVARILPVERMAHEQQLPEDPSLINWIELSPNSHWLATPSRSNGRILIFPWDGGAPQAVPRQPDGDVPRPPNSHNTWASEFGPRSDLLITGEFGSSMRFLSLPELKEVRTIELGGFHSWGDVRGDKLLTCTHMDEEGANLLLRAWSLPEGKPEVLGTFPRPKGGWDVNPSGTTVAYGREGTVCVRSVDRSRSIAERVLGQGGDEVRDVTFDRRGDRLASLHGSGEIRIWSMAGETADPLRVLRGPKYQAALLLFDPEGRLLTQAGPNGAVRIWDLNGPPDAEPVVVGRLSTGALYLGSFDPQGEWLATSYGIDTVEFWPLSTPRARAIRGISSSVWSMAFTSDSRWLASCAFGQPARLWPLSASDGAKRELLPEEPCVSLATHTTRNEVLVGTTKGKVFLCPTERGAPRPLPGGWTERAGRAAMAAPVAFDPTGRWAVATPYSGGRGFSDPADRVIRMWDLESEQERIYSIAHLTDADWDGAFFFSGFAADGRLYGSLGKGGEIVRLTLPAEPEGPIGSETVVTAGSSRSLLSPDGRLLLVLATSETTATHNFIYEQLLLFDLVKGTSRRITTHGTRLSVAAQFDPSGRVIVTGDIDGVVRVGPVSGEEPHLLLGHKGMVSSVAVSPDGRWIASATEESIRLWPMPDVTKPPLHTRSHDELLAKLDTFTNLRAVRDETSSTGWSLEVGPFSGWETVPEW